MSAVTDLAATLELLIVHDLDYPVRYGLVLQAAGLAAAAGLDAGIEHDPRVDPAYPVVVYIELTTGQIAWHLPQHRRPWDGHTTAEKHDRIRAWVAAVVAR